ncbi:T9SS type A sorting domain-containing protein [Chryseobacterium pennipullorum]|uniref:T9SS C-terminal target domain-containing protein n=1 Tax=Chryseobacterium pennipullorum TaxID=2258963 RepID=A0A3D9AYD1_9FLAO|nr:T9SS type A sorting domain-containing protein [Chryseobacterium pennipullorum]REC46343.1 T9SS C-terminal target domain-containing protein [Chryseobacterium pennipullorum]
MKKLLFPLFLVLLGVNAHAQQDFFAITGKNTQSIDFKDFRVINPTTGTSGAKIFTAESSPKIFSQSGRGIISENRNSYNNSQAVTMAALAYDPANNHLIYMPMFSSNIYVLNPHTGAIILVENTVAKVSSCDINSHITRMASGYDGNIYAVNNAGTQLLQISKEGGQYTVNDLGIIKDDPSNGRNSFTAMETGFGGDMVADSHNNFYIFSASGNVFKVSTKELKARFVGKIKGIPEHYSVNGAAVNEGGKVVVASAKGAPMYEVDMGSLQATKLPGEEGLHIYDLASKYFVNDRISSSVAMTDFDIYPTKVDEKYINVHMGKKSVKGSIKLNIYDMAGKNVMNDSFTIKEGAGDQKVFLRHLVSGAYIVNIMEESGKILFSKKIIITE